MSRLLLLLLVTLLFLSLTLTIEATRASLRRGVRLTDGPRGLLAGNEGVTRLGGDKPNQPIALPPNANSTLCATTCQQTAGCVGWSFFRANCGAVGSAPVCYLKEQLNKLSYDECASSASIDAYIAPPTFARLPSGSIMPRGWMSQQLKLQTTGLAGHLHLFYADVQNSTWVGGSHDSGIPEERLPYWMQGALPMAYLAQDDMLIQQIDAILNYILNHQNQTSGFLGPIPDDPWPRMPILFALTYYLEFVQTDARIVPAIYKYLEYLQVQLLTKKDISNWGWAIYRTHDLMMSIQYLYDYHPMGREQFLMDVDELVYQYGFDWKTWVRTSFPTGDVKNDGNLASHGVNNGQALKSTAVWYRQSHAVDDANFNYQRTELMDRYHGLASGIFGCDEHLAGNNPSRGSETCTVVEAMFSYETMFSVLGDTSFADRVEQLTFNALPATMDAEMWTHQYLQQTNQKAAAPQSDWWWNSDGGYSSVFGLEPNYPCCTVNFPQGWPRYIQHQYMMTQDSNSTGIVVALLGPSQLDITLEDPTYGDNTVHIIQDTNYPFEVTNSVNFTIAADHPFTLQIRIPGWCNAAAITNSDGSRAYPAGGALYKFYYKPSGPQDKQSLSLVLPAEFRITHRYNDAISVYYGPLLYGINFPYNMTVLRQYAFSAVDVQYLPTATWQYAILVDESDLSKSFSIGQQALPSLPFDPSQPPLLVSAYGRQIDWPVVHQGADVPPQSPVTSTQPLVPLQLIPFGSSMLRIGEIPYLAK